MIQVNRPSHVRTNTDQLKPLLITDLVKSTLSVKQFISIHEKESSQSDKDWSEFNQQIKSYLEVIKISYQMTSKQNKQNFIDVLNMIFENRQTKGDNNAFLTYSY